MEATTPLPPSVDIDEDELISVSELNEQISTVIEDRDLLENRFVGGDVSDLSVSNGNIHFDLVFDDASIHCVIFEYQRDSLATNPNEDMKVAVSGDLSYYSPRGSCSLLLNECVELGESAYTQIYKENKQKLDEDGLLDDEAKQELPKLPEHIGVVTSADSDARKDAVSAIHTNFPPVEITVRDTIVQGGDAMEELLNGISGFDRRKSVDLIVVTRGGGADKTLRVFNETPICRVISNTETPVVVGIGHEDDRTLAGEVADERVMTPTDVGTVVPDYDHLHDVADDVEQRLQKSYVDAIDDQVSELLSLVKRGYTDCVNSQLSTIHQQITLRYDKHISETIGTLNQELQTAINSAHQQRDFELSTLENRLTDAYAGYIDTRVTSLNTTLNAAEDKHISSILLNYEHTLDAAVVSYEQRQEYRINELQSQLENSYRNHINNTLRETRLSLTTTTETYIESRISELESELISTHNTYKQQQKHEVELESTVESIREETQQEIQATTKKYKIGIAALVLLVILLLIINMVFIL